jgi:diadenosine tetraphosphate (Ap4A) HIT family hydrolase
VCGHVAPDQVGPLFARVATLCKSQCFDMLLVAGTFVSSGCSADFSSEAHLQPYLSGAATVPVMTYFMHPALEPALVCENLVCVGAFGVMDLAGLRVAFLSSDDEGCADVVLRQAESEKLLAAGVDLMVSCAWPRDVLLGLPVAEAPSWATALPGAAGVARTATALAPRYVFAPSPGDFLERRPFELPKHRHVCRFLAVAPAGNARKQKWLFAFKLRAGEVSTKPDGTTPNPFVLASAAQQQQQQGQLMQKRRPRAEEEGDGGGFQRWASVPEGEGQQEGERRQKRSKDKLFRNADRGAACWFCLDSPNSEQHLVVSVGGEAYLTLAKGAMVPGHVLLLPVEHVPALVRASPATCVEMGRYMQALRAAAASRDERVMFYERNVAHQYDRPHCHVQALPLSAAQASRVGAQLEKGWKQWPLEPDGSLPLERMRRELSHSAYFWIEIGGVLHVSTMPSLDLDFGRTVYAQATDTPAARIHWKRCVLPAEEEKRMAEEFVAMFRPFDIVLPAAAGNRA